jgi:2-haloacid dehalogenase
VRRAAHDVGAVESAPAELVRRWDELTPWDDVAQVLASLADRGVRMGVVTNCSAVLGRKAAEEVERAVDLVRGGTAQGRFKFEVVVTAEEIGWYKPRKEAYQAVLRAMDGAEDMVTRQEVVFVAGSKWDVPGARGVGMRVVWHNRVGLPLMGEEAPEREGKTLVEAMRGIM